MKLKRFKHLERVDRPYRRFLKSFVYAGRGIAHCVAYGRNFRVELVVFAYMLYFSLFYDFTETHYSAFFLVSALVLVCEAFNTSIEAIADKVCTEKNELVRIGKDVAAGAVLIMAITSVAIGFYLFYDIKVFLNIINFHVRNPLVLILFILSIILTQVFIFLPEYIQKKDYLKEENDEQ